MDSNIFGLKLFMLPIINNKKIKESKFDVAMGNVAPIGLFSLAFNYYIDQSYENKNKIIGEQGTRTIYRVLNPFELYLNNIEKKNDMQDRIKNYLNIKNDIEDLLFMQFWEIIMLFNIMSTDQNIYISSNKKDIIEYVFEQFSKKVTKNNVKFIENDKNTSIVDISIITIEIPDAQILYRESVGFIGILEKLYNALSNIKNNGKLIIKLDDTYTMATCKMIQLCRMLFDNVYIYKPYYSRLSDSEKYLICIGFNNDDFKNIETKFKKSLDIIKNNKAFVIDFMEDIDLDISLKLSLEYINKILGGIQHKETNKMLTYINAKNYSGQEYQEALDNQINAVEFISSKFFPINAKDYANIQSEFIEQIKNRMKEMKDNI